MNKIIAIGYTGTLKCYLNTSKDEALKRFCKSEEVEMKGIDENIRIEEVTFEDEFEAHTIWEI